MQVFISWSGVRSLEVARLLKDWIGAVLQGTEPFLSEDLDRGSIWFGDLADTLASTSVGIVCLTAENQAAPWVNFEAGALMKGLKANRVCVFLVDLASKDVRDALFHFNHTEPNESGVRKLIATINKLADQRLDAHRLDQAFARWFPEFEERFKKILDSTTTSPPPPRREQAEVLDEMLGLVRDIARQRDRKDDVVVEAVHFETLVETAAKFLKWGNTPPEKVVNVLTMRYQVSNSVASEAVAQALERDPEIKVRPKRSGPPAEINF